MGLKQDKNSGLVIDDLNRLSGKITHFGDEKKRASQASSSSSEHRYFTMKLPPTSMKSLTAGSTLTQHLLEKTNEKDSGKSASLQEEFVSFTPEDTHDDELDEFEVNDMQTDEKRYLLKTRDLNVRMAAEKNQLQFWLELLDVQNLAKDSMFSGKEKLIIEKKISILDKALESPSLRTNLFLKLLRLDLLRMSEKNEDQYKLVNREFNKMLEELPDPDGQVLALYLDFRHSYFINFSASILRRNMKEIVSAYKEILEGATSTADIKKNEQLLYTVLVYGVLTECRMGYTEKAIGVLIALSEANIFNPGESSRLPQLWEDHSLPKVGELNPTSKEHVYTFEQRLLHTLGMDTKEFTHQFLDKQAISLENFSEKESAYVKLYWRPANSGTEKVD